MKWTVLSFRVSLLFAAVASFANATEKNAESLNSQGVKLLRQAKVSEAIPLFRKAIQTDSSHALAHYNLACALNRQRQAGIENDPDYGRESLKEILSLVQKAIQLDKKRKARALQDADLEDLRGTVFFQVLAGKYDPKTGRGLETVLTQKGWSSKNECGGGLSGDVLKFDSSKGVTAGCGNNYDEGKSLAKGFTVKGNTILLKTPQTEVKELRFLFENLEGRIETFGQLENPNVWFEISGYVPSP